MTQKTIHNQLLKIIRYFLGSSVIFFLCTLILSNTIFSNLHTLIDQQNRYTSYRAAIDGLQEEVFTSLYNPDENSEARLLTTIEEVDNLAVSMKNSFPYPQFLDNYAATQAYLAAIQDYMDCPPETRDEKVQAYQQTQNIYEQTLNQYATTLPFEQTHLYNQMQQITDKWYAYELFIVFLFLLVILFTFIDTKRLIQELVPPIELLTKHAEYISNGSYQEILKLSTQNFASRELQTLSMAFVRMGQTIQAQMEELKEKIVLAEKVHELEIENMTTQILLTKTENSLMQSLINPHFLFNCLSMLSGLAVMEHAPRVHDYAIQIAQFLRESLNYIGKQITLKEEFAYTERYIAIQRLRFGDRISFHVHCADECQKLVVPAILLQPLVENALIHGVASFLKNGKISVSAILEGDKVVLLVEDNGVGMGEGEIARLTKELGERFEIGKKGTGLHSVAYRLKQLFHDQAEFSLKSERHHTQVRISLPYNRS